MKMWVRSPKRDARLQGSINFVAGLSIWSCWGHSQFSWDFFLLMIDWLCTLRDCTRMENSKKDQFYQIFPDVFCCLKFLWLLPMFDEWPRNHKNITKEWVVVNMGSYIYVQEWFVFMVQVDIPINPISNTLKENLQRCLGVIFDLQGFSIVLQGVYL